MTSKSSTGSQDETLNDSWVEFSDVSSGDRGTPSSVSVKPPASSASSSVVRLLMEAQKESSVKSSYAFGQRSFSPASCNSTVGSELIGDASQIDSDLGESSSWVQQWSSRPEIVPPSITAATHDVRHSSQPRRHWLSIRNTGIMRGVVFIAEHLPALLISHACSFLLGAVTMVVYMKKYGRFSPVVTSAMACKT